MSSKSSTPAKKRPRADECFKRVTTTDTRQQNRMLCHSGHDATTTTITGMADSISHPRSVSSQSSKGSPFQATGRAEGVTTRLASQREQAAQAARQAWFNEVERTPQQEQQAAPQRESEVLKTTEAQQSTYRTVLAKRGLLVRDTLGAGSYSKVKLAHFLNQNDQPLYPNQVAVKIIDRARAPRDFQEKFLPRELEVWPTLRHPNIVLMLDYFQENSRVYMILEYCERGDALRYIQTAGALSENVGRVWVHQVCDAVRYLHDMNITHRDLKLENMLIDNNRNIKLCDFGFVKTGCVSDLSKTFCGSKSYAAPEILKGEPYEPKKADIWAIGVILYILVTARMPFDEAKGNQSLLMEHRALELQWPRARRAVSAQCKSLAIFCFKFNWAERPTIHQLLAHQWFRSTAK